MSQQFEESLSQVQFSQVIPDASAQIPSARAYEENNLSNLDPSTQNRIVTDLSRLLLFKALSGEPIDRTKITKEAWGERYTNYKNMTNATLDRSVERMRKVLGMDVKRLTDDQLKDIPNKYRERMYVINTVEDDATGSHSMALHRVHLDSAIEKGLLMMVLAFIYCKGDVKNQVRWLPAGVLYRLLHTVDENIPAEPAVVKNKRESVGDLASPSAKFSDRAGVGLTPDVDSLLEKFVHMDYLIKKKADKKENGAVPTSADEATFVYAMGPRSLLEIGRKQVLYFCSEILEENEPDPTMLAELQGQNEEEDVTMDG